MRILLTGSGGLVGSNILKKLDESQYQTFAPRRTELDLMQFDRVRDYVSDVKPDLVIHCAGRVGGIKANINNPSAFLFENLQIGTNIVIASKEAGVSKLLNMGSSCMYPRNSKNPITEDSILTGELEPTNEGYALAKIAVARLCQYISQENPKFQFKTAIPCNIYGPNDNFDPETAHMIPATIRKVFVAHKQGHDDVEIWGDGTARREFMHVDDLADFVSFAIKHFDQMPSLLNVGLGFDYSINEYYQKVIKIIGFEGKIKHDLSKPTGMKQKLVDTTNLKKFGWAAKTSLEDGLKNTLEYYIKAESQL